MIIVRAPVRISFGGGGTDLEAYFGRFGGFVVSAAISRYCYVNVGEPVDGLIRITSADYRLCETFREMPPVREPLVLPKAAIEYFADRGLRQRGLNLFLASDVPPGTGLGSSSAMAVALVRALAAYLGLPMERPEVAELAARLEIERLDMPIGKQDHYASALGGVNALTFTQGGVGVEPLPLPPKLLTQLGARLLLFSTGLSHHSAKILRQQRRDTTAKPAVIESLHRMKSLAQAMRSALLDGDLDGFGALLDLAWRHKKRLSGMISSEAIDRWYTAARAAGALGGKITGAGGGGFLLLYSPPQRQRAVKEAMARFGLRELSFDLDRAGIQVLITGSRGDQFAGTVPRRQHLVGSLDREEASIDHAG